jgi:hypothetical protein
VEVKTRTLSPQIAEKDAAPAKMLYQYPASPLGPVDVSGPVEQMVAFCVVYLLLLSIVLLALPEKWAGRLIQVAFHLRSEKVDGEIR